MNNEQGDPENIEYRVNSQNSSDESNRNRFIRNKNFKYNPSDEREDYFSQNENQNSFNFGYNSEYHSKLETPEGEAYYFSNNKYPQTGSSQAYQSERETNSFKNEKSQNHPNLMQHFQKNSIRYSQEGQSQQNSQTQIFSEESLGMRHNPSGYGITSPDESSSLSQISMSSSEIKDNKGLKYLSTWVQDVVAEHSEVSYQKVSEYIIEKFNSSSFQVLTSLEEIEKNDQNIKRRVYDSLNVLIAAKLIVRTGRKVKINDSERHTSINPQRYQMFSLKAKLVN